jgi:hypothetical protein
MLGRKIRVYGPVLLAGFGVAGAGASETGTSIGINFATVVGGGGPSPTDSIIPAGGVAGLPAVEQTNWNDPGPGTGTLSGLTLDRLGTAETSSVNITWKSQGPSDPTSNNHFQSQTSGPPALQNFEMYQGYLDTDDNTTTRVNVRNLPATDFAGGYDLYVYFLGSTSARGGTYGVGPIFTPPPDDPNAVPSVTFQPNKLLNNQSGAWISDPEIGDVFVPSGPEFNGPDFAEDAGASFDDVGNYAVFRGLTALEFTLFATTVGDRTYGFGDRERAPISGIQLVVAPPPVREWISDADDNWSVSGDWSPTGAPNQTSAVANFLSTGAASGDRTVTLDSPQTVGTLNFNPAAHSYTLAGTSALTLDVGSGDAAINVSLGSHTISAPLVLAKNTKITIDPPGGKLTLTDLQSSAVSVTKEGNGKLEVNNIRAGGLSVNAGNVTITANGTQSGTSIVNALTIAGASDAWTAQLDIKDNDVIVHSDDAGRVAKAAEITNQLKQGANFANTGQFWTGNGMITSLGGNGSTSYTAVGVAVNDFSLLGGAQTGAIYSSFDGQDVGVNDVLVKYTYFGDADLDGAVTTNDYFQIDNGFLGSKTGWINGDFDYDGAVTTNDYFLIDNAFLGQGAALVPAAVGSAQPLSGVTAVPEPASLGFLAFAAASGALLRRRRRSLSHVPAMSGAG